MQYYAVIASITIYEGDAFTVGQHEAPFFLLVSYVEERLWWPIQSPNKGRKKKASS